MVGKRAASIWVYIEFIADSDPTLRLFFTRFLFHEEILNLTGFENLSGLVDKFRKLLKAHS